MLTSMTTTSIECIIKVEQFDEQFDVQFVFRHNNEILNPETQVFEKSIQLINMIQMKLI